MTTMRVKHLVSGEVIRFLVLLLLSDADLVKEKLDARQTNSAVAIIAGREL